MDPFFVELSKKGNTSRHHPPTYSLFLILVEFKATVQYKDNHLPQEVFHGNSHH